MLNTNQKNIVEDLVRIKLLMSYSNKKTLTENSVISEQDDIFVGEPGERAFRAGQTIREYQKQKKKELDAEIEGYKNSCRYPDKVVVPTKDHMGLTGMETVKAVNWEKSKDGKVQYSWCAYPWKNGVAWTPNNSVVKFWDIAGISEMADTFVKQMEEFGAGHPTAYVWNKWDKNDVIKQMSNLCKLGTIDYVKIGNTPGTDTFKSSFQWDVEGNNPLTPYSLQHIIKYIGLTNNEGKSLPQPVWNDPRSEYEKFIDDYGELIQWCTVIAGFIAGYFTGGATWVVIAEIAVDLVVGVAVGARQLETGDNIGAVMSFVCSVAPFIKLPNVFKGIKPSEFKALGKKFADSGLTSQSTVEDFVKFHNGLSEGEKKIMNLTFVNSDEMVEAQFKTAFKEGCEKLSKDPQELMDFVSNIAKTDKNLFTPIKWFKRMAAVEFTIQISSFFVGLALEIFFGEQLNDEQKKLLTSVHAKTPDSMKKYWLTNVVENIKSPEQLTKMLREQNEGLKKVIQFESTAENVASYVKMQIDQSIENNTGTVVSGEGLTDVKDPKEITVSTLEELNKLKSEEGWITINELGRQKFVEVVKITNVLTDSNGNRIYALYKPKLEIKNNTNKKL